MEIVEIVVRGSNLGICPKCGNGNAMFDQRKWNHEQESTERYFECRDCGYIVDADYAIVVVTELDKKGMGNLSTYHEVKRVKGIDWIG